MTYRNTEVVDAAQEKFSFLIQDYGFAAIVRDARGTYLSQIVFKRDHLEIEIGVWGQGNELWMIFTPTVEAIYDGKVLHPKKHLEIEPNIPVFDLLSQSMHPRSHSWM